MDWTLVAQRMRKIMTGESVKQHMLKIRDARDSAEMWSPAQGVGRSAMGTRRGVVRYPPPEAKNALSEKKKRGKAKGEPAGSIFKVDGTEIVDDKKYSGDLENAPKSIRHKTLLYAPAIPALRNINETPAERAEPAEGKLIVSLAINKRKFEDDEEPASPQTPKRTKLSGGESEAQNDAPPKRGKGRTRPPLGSNFPLAALEEQVKERHRLAASTIPSTAPAAKQDNEIVVKKPVKQHLFKKPKAMPAKPVEAPISTTRTLRSNVTREEAPTGNEPSQPVEGAMGSRVDEYTTESVMQGVENVQENDQVHQDAPRMFGQESPFSGGDQFFGGEDDLFAGIDFDFNTIEDGSNLPNDDFTFEDWIDPTGGDGDDDLFDADKLI